MGSKKYYIRDKRSPNPLSERVSQSMSSNKASNTSPELSLRKALQSNKLKGYRLHRKDLPGRPDIVCSKIKLAIFVNGCFWHRCPYCNLPLPKSNTDFWKNKFERNQLRDERKTDELKKLGWTVLTIWECQIKNELDQCIKVIKRKFI